MTEPSTRRLVLVAENLDGRGGMDRVHAELIKSLSHKWDITVISATMPLELRELVKWHRIPLPRRPAPLRYICFCVLGGLRLRSLRGLVHVAGAVVPNRADIASVHLCHAGLVAATGRLAPANAPLARRLNTTVNRFLALAAERWCYRPTRLRRFHAVSNGVADELRTHYPGVPITVIPNAVDTDRYQPDSTIRERIRREQGVPDTTVVALFVAADWDHKGLDIAIDGVALASRECEALELWVVGSGDQSRFADRAATAGIATRIRFFGWQADPSDFYKASDIFVLPSRYEADPLVALEAAACCLPVVATAVNGVVELLGDAQAGMIIERDRDDLARALAALAVSADLRRSLGAEGRKRVQGRGGWDQIADRLGQQFEELAAASRPF
jgi:glycosyltransferase involved in cell wall biosynthesis